jgi:hypothetical protein
MDEKLIEQIVTKNTWICHASYDGGCWDDPEDYGWSVMVFGYGISNHPTQEEAEKSLSIVRDNMKRSLRENTGVSFNG